MSQLSRCKLTRVRKTVEETVWKDVLTTIRRSEDLTVPPLVGCCRWNHASQSPQQPHAQHRVLRQPHKQTKDYHRTTNTTQTHRPSSKKRVKKLEKSYHTASQHKRTQKQTRGAQTAYSRHTCRHHHKVPTTPACTWWNRPEEDPSSGKLESTHPSRTSVKYDQVFFVSSQSCVSTLPH